jgi:hypothetical protein
MPEESHYVLPKKKPDYWTLIGFGVLFGGIIVLVLVTALVEDLRDRWVFGHMAGATHLWEAKKSTPQLVDVSLALKHLSAVPPASPEAAEAKALEKALRLKQSEMGAAEAAHAAEESRKQAESAQTAKEAGEARAASVRQFQTVLRNVGYDLSAEASSDDRNEVVITSKEFDETDRRIRFLSFLRKEWGPAGTICWQGFSKVRLRSSKIPLVGFSESYSLCQ